MSNRIDIGNVRGIQGEKGEKGDKGSTPSYTDLKYDKQNDKFVTLKGTGDIRQYYLDLNGEICNEEGYILDEEFNPTNVQGEPFDESQYGYAYKSIWIDSEGHFTNEKGELIDEDGNLQYAESSFISDVTSYIYSDDERYGKLISDIYPHITDTLISANPNDEKFKNFFDEIEGDIKYYICEDDPKSSIYLNDNDVLVNTCKYYDDDGNIVLDGNDDYASVPLEKNALYLYNNHGLDDNDIMHYNIYLCKKANTVPIKLISSNDYEMNYNVIDELKIEVSQSENLSEDEKDVFLKLLTRGTRGQFYSMSDVDTLFENNVINKLGEPNGIAQLNSAGKIPSSQLPTHIDDVIEGTMNNDATIFTPSNSSDNNSVEQKSKIYVDVNSKKTYRWSGSVYILIDDITGNNIDVDNTLSSSSNNPVQNSVITSKFTTLESDINNSLDSLGDDIDNINNELILKEDYVNKVTTLTNHNDGTTYPSTSAVHTALSSKENISNKSNGIYTSDSNKYPTCVAVKNELYSCYDKNGIDSILRDMDSFEVGNSYQQGFMAYGISNCLLNHVVNEEGVYHVPISYNRNSSDLYYYYDGENIFCLSQLNYEITVSNYNPSLNSQIIITVKILDRYGNTVNLENIELKIYKNSSNDTVNLISGIDSNEEGCASYTMVCNEKGLKRISVISNYSFKDVFIFVS